MNGKTEDSIAIVLLLILFFSNSLYGQWEIKGYLKDSMGNAIGYGNVVLKIKDKDKIVDYTVSEENGSFILNTNENGLYDLFFYCLGFKAKKVSILLINEKYKLSKDIILIEDIVELKEVVIKPNIPLLIKKDTITFKTKHFVNGTEQTVEDLLKKIPGLQIDSKGTIKVGNQEIAKLMVDGDDLFEKGYKILSKNMPVFPIEELKF